MSEDKQAWPTSVLEVEMEKSDFSPPRPVDAIGCDRSDESFCQISVNVLFVNCGRPQVSNAKVSCLIPTSP